MTAEKRIKKYSTRPLKKFSKIRPFFVYPVWLRTRKPARKFMKTIIRDFFFIQLKEKFHIIKIPLIFVDNPLDDKIPFTPKKINDYMTFVDFIIKSLDFFHKRLGYKESAEFANSYITLVESLYYNAATIYKFSMTTTKRPKYYRGRFFTIHFFDPHFLCVPSLHVSVSAGIYTWFKKFFESEDSKMIPKEEAEWRLNEIREWAVRIVESVLLVKQHSINCIPAAFYMLTTTGGENFFSINDAVDFINMLFKDEISISSDDKKTLIEHFHFLYERFLLENKYSHRWQEPVEHWLDELREKQPTE